MAGLFEFLGQFLHDCFRITQSQQNAGTSDNSLLGASIPNQALQIGPVLFQQRKHASTQARRLPMMGSLAAGQHDPDDAQNLRICSKTY